MTKEETIRQAMASIENRIRHIYNQGFEAGRKAERKTGKWLVLHDEYGDVVEAVCSLCDINGNHKWQYCPYCGARMEGAEE